MIIKNFTYCNIVFFIFILTTGTIVGQVSSDGIPYQTIVRSSSGIPLTNQIVAIKFGIYKGSASGLLAWEETFLKTTDTKGLLKATIGTGATTGAGLSSSFSLINWSDNSYYLKVEVDISGGTSYENLGSVQLLSVPYAFYSIQTDKVSNYYLDQLIDVSVPSPLIGKIIKWNGSFWIADNDNFSDTVAFAYNSFYASTSDTAVYAYSSFVGDSILFAYYSDTALFANSASSSNATNNSNYSDTASYALASAPVAWLTSGNTNTTVANYIGSNDLQDVILKTNNLEVMRVSAGGSLLISGASNSASFSMIGNDGLLSAGTFGSGILPTTGAGEKFMWYPKKSSFRAGGISSNQWDDLNIGNYSFAAGYNCIAGNYSFAAGNASTASGDYTVAIGRKALATATGVYPSGVSVSIGDSCLASTPRSFAMGRGCIASTNNATIAIGFNNLATGAIATAFGTKSIATGSYSFALGYYGSTNLRTGSFVYADASSTIITNSTLNNQFLVRASGGVIFYSDSLNTMGVILPAGGGSWASVSDKNKKEHFQLVNAEEVLDKIEKLEISSWNYKSQHPSIRHIGPMAQDFYKAFKLGDNNKTISVMDMDGITLVGIKSLHQRINFLAHLNEIDELGSKVDALDNFKDLNSRLDELEKKLADQQNH